MKINLLKLFKSFLCDHLFELSTTYMDFDTGDHIENLKCKYCGKKKVVRM